MNRRLRVAQWIAASNAFVFGAWIVLASFRSTMFQVRVLFAPEWVWALLPVVGGLLLALSVWRGDRTGGKAGRIAGSVISMFFFVGVTIILVLKNYEITTLPLIFHAALLYALLAIAEASSDE